VVITTAARFFCVTITAMQKAIALTFVPLLLSGWLSSCGEKSTPPTPPTSPTPNSPAESNVDEGYGAKSLDDFSRKFRRMVSDKDIKAYRMLHCEELPPQITAAMAGRKADLPVFDYIHLDVKTEPLSKADLNRASANTNWNIPPTHWLIAQGEERSQFSTWELGESEGRYYIASRIPVKK
jgi:hypothetical protein